MAGQPQQGVPSSKKKAVARAVKAVSQEVGDGVRITVEGNKVTVELDLLNDFGPSGSGKSRIIASTHGFTHVEDGVSLNLNLVRSIR